MFQLVNCEVVWSAARVVAWTEASETAEATKAIRFFSETQPPPIPSSRPTTIPPILRFLTLMQCARRLLLEGHLGVEVQGVDF